MPETPVVQLLDTPVGPARTLTEGRSGGSAGVLVLGHGAGGGVEAPDLLAARDAGLSLGMVVVRVEQPWRVRGARIAESPARLDLAWVAVVATLTGSGPLVVGGRSAGARVACRTAGALGAAAVLALAFPLQPPRGRPSRLVELHTPAAPRLVVQGSRDAFGVPDPGPGLEVRVVAGADHGFTVRRADLRSADEVAAEVRTAVEDWLARTVRR